MREKITIFRNGRKDKFVNTNNGVYAIRDILLFSEFKSASVDGNQVVIGIFVFYRILLLFYFSIFILSLIYSDHRSKVVIGILQSERRAVSIHITGYFTVFQDISECFGFFFISDKNLFTFPFYIVNHFLRFALCFYGISDFLNLSAFSISQGIFYRAQIIRKDDFGERFLHFVHNHFHRPQFILLIVLAHDDLLVTGFCVGRHGKGHACSRERCPFDV